MSCAFVSTLLLEMVNHIWNRKARPQWGSCTGWSRCRACRRWWSSRAGAGDPWGRGAPWRPCSTPCRSASSCTCRSCPCCSARSPRSWARCDHPWVTIIISGHVTPMLTSPRPSGCWCRQTWWCRRSGCGSSRTPPGRWCSRCNPTPWDRRAQRGCKPAKS